MFPVAQNRQIAMLIAFFLQIIYVIVVTSVHIFSAGAN